MVGTLNVLKRRFTSLRAFPVIVDNSSPVIAFPRLPDETNASPRLSWTSTEDARFECSLDGAAFKSCGSGLNGVWNGRNLTHGKHVFSVRGIDKNGNVGEPTKHTWNVGKCEQVVPFSSGLVFNTKLVVFYNSVCSVCIQCCAFHLGSFVLDFVVKVLVYFF